MQQGQGSSFGVDPRPWDARVKVGPGQRPADELANRITGLRVSREKPEHMHCNFSGTNSSNSVHLQGTPLKEADHFNYLGSVMVTFDSQSCNDGSIDADVTHRVNTGWRK
ncbi:hypothetical protein ACJJTC_012114 [Scirpophaga incertulas]